MRCVTAVDAEWLAELAPMFFSVKASALSSLDAKKNEKRNRQQMILEMEEEMRKKQEEIEMSKPKLAKRKQVIYTLGGGLKKGMQLKSMRRVGL